jgi:hypothetical protein
MNKRTQLRAIKGYASEENVVFVQGDIVEVLGTEEGWLDLVGIYGWCNGIEMSFTPKVIVEHFCIYTE